MKSREENNRIFREREAKGLPHSFMFKRTKYGDMEFDFIAVDYNMAAMGVYKIQKLYDGIKDFDPKRKCKVTWGADRDGSSTYLSISNCPNAIIDEVFEIFERIVLDPVNWDKNSYFKQSWGV